MAKAKKKGKGPLDTTVLPVSGLSLLVAALVRALTRQKAAAEAGAPTGNVVSLRAQSEPAKPPEPEAARPKGVKGVIDVGKRVQKRYGELHGNNLAAAITFQAFVSLFPLLLVILGVVGFISAGSGTDVAGKIIHGLGLNGDAGLAVRSTLKAAEHSRKATSVVGLVTLLWSGLGLVNGMQYGYDQVWQVKERGMKDKAVGMVWLFGAAVLFVGAAAATTVVGWLPGVVAPIGIVVGLLGNFGLWLWTAKVLPNRDVGWKALIPGAIFGAIGLEVLKALGGILVPRMVASSSALYGSLGVVFAILGWLLFFGRLIIYSAVLNVTLYEKDHGTEAAVIEVPSDGRPTGEVTRSGQARDGLEATGT
jgi:membrane protein